MKRMLIACTVALVLPAIAADSELGIETRFNGMDIHVEALGVPEAEFSKDVDVRGVRAVRVTNHSNEVASCQFEAQPGETAMTASPAVSIRPHEESVMRIPGEYSAGGPRAILHCRPESAPLPAGEGRA